MTIVDVRSHGYWSKYEIKEAIGRWFEEHGRIPTSKEWVSGGDYWPPHNVVKRRFGTWNKAIEAAGFEPRPGRMPLHGEPMLELISSLEVRASLYDKFSAKCSELGISHLWGVREAVAAWTEQYEHDF